MRVDDKISEENASNGSKPCFYMPHFNTSQAKFRVVYDAAREYRGVFLNDMLERGPIFMQSLRSILIRFCEHKYGVVSDITNMFFQIQIAPEDRDMLRILWFDGPDMQGDIAAFQFQIAPYGLRCIPSIAGYAMIYTAEKNTPSVSTDATSRVKRDMFVDDFISGVDSVEEGQKVVNEVTKLLKSTEFTLSKWNASHKEILAEISEDDLAPSIRNIQQESNGATSSLQHQTTLGLIWDTDTDMISVKKPRLHPVSEGSFTKRQAVSCNHQLFDPLSWWASFQTRLNLCCSKIVRQVADWDAQVPTELVKEWNIAINDLIDIKTLSIPRRHIPFNVSKDSTFQYHAFADSSKDTAAAAVYLRVQTDDKCDVSLVAAKTSIFSQAEMNRESMPRKEIIAVDMGARLLKECLDSTTLPIERHELWSDSQTVIK